MNVFFPDRGLRPFKVLMMSKEELNTQVTESVTGHRGAEPPQPWVARAVLKIPCFFLLSHFSSSDLIEASIFPWKIICFFHFYVDKPTFSNDL